MSACMQMDRDCFRQEPVGVMYYEYRRGYVRVNGAYTWTWAWNVYGPTYLYANCGYEFPTGWIKGIDGLEFV